MLGKPGTKTASPKKFNFSDDWMKYMRHGLFEYAWKLNDRALQSGIKSYFRKESRHYQVIWDGTPLNQKRVLIRCYHGLGDTIQFIRYATMLKKIAREVIVWSQPQLTELLKTAEGIDKLIPLNDRSPETDYDIDVEIMELPYVFRTTLSNIPHHVPYLFTDPVSPGGGRLSVGLFWKGGDWDPLRNIPFELLLPLFDIANVTFYILQTDPQAAGWIDGFGICPGEYPLNDFARIIGGLDLLITVDSMPAHLAGALNIPVWVMLQANADWRWMEERYDSPWYPGMKLFRQKKQGEWRPVILSIASELQELSTRCTCGKLFSQRSESFSHFTYPSLMISYTIVEGSYCTRP